MAKTSTQMRLRHHRSTPAVRRADSPTLISKDPNIHRTRKLRNGQWRELEGPSSRKARGYDVEAYEVGAEAEPHDKRHTRGYACKEHDCVPRPDS